MTVRANDYLDKLVEYCIMKLYAVCTVQETRQTWAGEDDFQVLKPSIEIRVSLRYFYFLFVITQQRYSRPAKSGGGRDANFPYPFLS